MRAEPSATHAAVSDPLQGVPQVEVEAAVVRPRFPRLETLLLKEVRPGWSSEQPAPVPLGGPLTFRYGMLSAILFSDFRINP